MASITSTGAGESRRYIVNYRDDGGRQRRKTFRRKADAQAFGSQVEVAKQRGTFIDPAAGRVSFREFAQTWLESQTCDIASRGVFDQHLRLHAFPTLGDRPLRSIKPSTIQAWLRGLEGLSVTYQKAILGTVSSVFSAAVDDALVAANPCRAGSVRTPTRPERKVEPWPTEQVRAVVNALPQRYKIVAVIAAGLGLRQGEIFGLAVSDVDFLRSTVTVRRQVRYFPKGGTVFRATKGKASREIPLPESVKQELAAHLASFPAMNVTLPEGVPSGRAAAHELIVSRPEGGPLIRAAFNRQVWGPALAKAGVTQTRETGCHALRHYYASVLLDAGESIKAVSEYLGHSDPGFTLRTYAHVMPSSADRTRAAVDRALGCYKTGTSATG